jgi:hypothetical protein
VGEIVRSFFWRRTYVVEFRTAGGEALAISIPRTEAFQERMPYGLFVPDVL